MSDPGTLHLDTDGITALAAQLRRCAETLRADEGGLDRDVPAVPFDAFGLQARIRELDEERQSFEERLTRLVAGAAEQAELQVAYTADADG